MRIVFKNKEVLEDVSPEIIKIIGDRLTSKTDAFSLQTFTDTEGKIILIVDLSEVLYIYIK